ncbi:UNVERIFIED_CONTAM: methyltransferase family protein [Acetivibrio alkalicellulosi]
MEEANLAKNNNKSNYIKRYYESNMKKDVPDYKILGWESRESQNLRFDVLISNLELENKKILDVGCGLGNLLEYLQEKNIKAEYTGVDILDSMIERVKHKKLKGTFYHMDIFESDYFSEGAFDVVYASGIFNLNLNNNMEFLSYALRRFFYLASSIVVFNLLHEKSPDKEDLYFYYDPKKVLNMIEEKHTFLKNIRVVEGYLNNDFTVICQKKQSYI